MTPWLLGFFGHLPFLRPDYPLDKPYPPHRSTWKQRTRRYRHHGQGKRRKR